jgi:hypothetical protein
VFRQSSDGKLSTFGPLSNTTLQMAVQNWTSATLVSATAAFNVWFSGCPLVWLRIADDGTNRIYSTSADGQNWRTFYSVSRTTFLTSGADEVGFFIQPRHATVGIGATLVSWVEA